MDDNLNTIKRQERHKNTILKSYKNTERQHTWFMDGNFVIPVLHTKRINKLLVAIQSP